MGENPAGAMLDSRFAEGRRSQTREFSLGRQALVHYLCFSFKKNKNYHSVLYWVSTASCSICLGRYHVVVYLDRWECQVYLPYSDRKVWRIWVRRMVTAVHQRVSDGLDIVPLHSSMKWFCLLNLPSLVNKRWSSLRPLTRIKTFYPVALSQLWGLPCLLLPVSSP